MLPRFPFPESRKKEKDGKGHLEEGKLGFWGFLCCQALTPKENAEALEMVSKLGDRIKIMGVISIKV